MGRDANSPVGTTIGTVGVVCVIGPGEQAPVVTPPPVGPVATATPTAPRHLPLLVQPETSATAPARS